MEKRSVSPVSKSSANNSNALRPSSKASSNNNVPSKPVSPNNSSSSAPRPSVQAELSSLKEKVAQKFGPNNESKNVVIAASRTFGEKASDWLTTFVGSWKFIILSVCVIVLWILLNTSWLFFGSEWDPRPFIMLNLLLSILAALQAPIILMSQNRQGEKDRVRFEYDYAVNRKAEREISEIKVQLARIDRKLSPAKK